MIPSNASIEEILKDMPPSRGLELLEAKLFPLLEEVEDLKGEYAKLEGKYEELDCDDDNKFDLLTLIYDKCKERSGTRKELATSILIYIEESGVEL
jgi:hypothetical protein